VKNEHRKINPAEAGLTNAELKCFLIIESRQKDGKVTKTGDITKALKKHRSHIYRTVLRLRDKGLIETYGGETSNGHFFRLKQ